MNSDNRFLVYISLVRPLNFLIVFLTVIVAAVICLEGDYSYKKILLTALTASLTAAAGNILNDIKDIEGDKINHPSRPLPNGLLSTQSAISYYIYVALLSLILSFFISLPHFIINASAALLLALYSLYLKKKSLIGNMVVALLTGAVFIYGGLGADNIQIAFIPAFFAAMINFIRELIKDMEDLKGDENVGIHSYPSRYGLQKTREVITFLLILLIILTFVPFIFGVYGKMYMLAVLFIVDPLLFFIILKINSKGNTLSLNNLSFILKLNMIFGLIAVYLGK